MEPRLCRARGTRTIRLGVRRSVRPCTITGHDAVLAVTEHHDSAGGRPRLLLSAGRFEALPAEDDSHRS